MKRFVRMGGCGMTKGDVERVCICTAAGAEGGTPALPAKAYVGEQQLQRAGDLVDKDQPAWPDLSHTEIYRIMNAVPISGLRNASCCGDRRAAAP